MVYFGQMRIAYPGRSRKYIDGSFPPVRSADGSLLLFLSLPNALHKSHYSRRRHDQTVKPHATHMM